MNATMLVFVLAVAMSTPTCAVTAGIARDGTLYSDRFRGWYKVSVKTLDGDLRGGCYNDANPLPVKSVKLFIAPHAPKSKIDQVFSIMEKEGWSRDRLVIERWKNDPNEP